MLSFLFIMIDLLIPYSSSTSGGSLQKSNCISKNKSVIIIERKKYSWLQSGSVSPSVQLGLFVNLGRLEEWTYLAQTFRIIPLAVRYLYNKYRNVSMSILNMTISLFMDWFQPNFIFIWNNCLIIINSKKTIICKINFDIIWYSLIFAATLYLSLFVWSSDFSSFTYMNVVNVVIVQL